MKWCLVTWPSDILSADKPQFYQKRPFMAHMERKDNFKLSSGRARWKKQNSFLTSFIQPETSVDVIGTMWFHKLSYAYVI